MVPQVIVSAHAPVEITKLHKIGLGEAVLEAIVCFGVLNGMKGQMKGIEVSLNIFCEWL